MQSKKTLTVTPRIITRPRDVHLVVQAHTLQGAQLARTANLLNSCWERCQLPIHQLVMFLRTIGANTALSPASLQISRILNANRKIICFRTSREQVVAVRYQRVEYKIPSGGETS